MADKVFLLLGVWTVCVHSWSRQVTLDPDGKFNVSWDLVPSIRDRSDLDIVFELEVETTGWVGIGLSPTGSMRNADIAVGWIDGAGTKFMQDRYAPSNGFPLEDNVNDITLLEGSENDGKTKMKFRRALKTCDTEGDREITKDTVRLIYAFGLSDPLDNTFSPAEKHEAAMRGSRSVYLLDQARPSAAVPLDAMTHDMTLDSYHIPANRTTYYCSFHSGPQVAGKNHVVGISPIISAGNEAVVHHFVLYACWDLRLEHLRNSNKTHGVCFNREMAEFQMSCHETVYAWAVGGSDFYFPEGTGYSIGTADSSSPSFFMLQTHYDNPEGRQDIIDSSGVRLLYSPSIRQNDVGNLPLGDVPGIFIPPNSSRFRLVAYCHSSCTEKWIPEGGITVFSYFLHSHLLGRKIQIDWYRDGQHVGVFASDQNYDFNFQENRLLDSYKTILPGDTLKITCAMNSEDRDRVTYGGEDTIKEMCLAFLLYYPRQKMLGCSSMLTFEEAGDNSVYSILGLSSPESPSLLKFRDLLDGVTWDDSKRADAQTAYDDASYTSICFRSQNERIAGTDVKFEGREFESVSDNDESDSCSLRNSNSGSRLSLAAADVLVLLSATSLLELYLF